MPKAHDISFKRLRDGSWGVIGPAKSVRAGVVTVRTKSGDTKTVEITGVSRPFNGLRIGYLAGRATGRSGGLGRSRMCPNCDSEELEGGECWECGYRR